MICSSGENWEEFKILQNQLYRLHLSDVQVRRELELFEAFGKSSLPSPPQQSAAQGELSAMKPWWNHGYRLHAGDLQLGDGSVQLLPGQVSPRVDVTQKILLGVGWVLLQPAVDGVLGWGGQHQQKIPQNPIKKTKNPTLLMQDVKAVPSCAVFSAVGEEWVDL